MYGIYKCEDFNVENNVLTVWDAELIGMAKSVDDFNRVYEIFCKGKGILPNGLICPALYCEQREITLCVFENSQK
jgi:hypothetical protein